jgi:hypothetical protein
MKRQRARIQRARRPVAKPRQRRDLPTKEEVDREVTRIREQQDANAPSHTFLPPSAA